MSDEPQSTYKKLEMPEVSCEIPEAILNKFPSEYAEVIKNQNIQMQYIKWMCEAIIDTNEQVRKTNGRVIKLERITEDVLDDHETTKKLKEHHTKLLNWKTLGAIVFTMLASVLGMAVAVSKIFAQFIQ